MPLGGGLRTDSTTKERAYVAGNDPVPTPVLPLQYYGTTGLGPSCTNPPPGRNEYAAGVDGYSSWYDLYG